MRCVVPAWVLLASLPAAAAPAGAPVDPKAAFCGVGFTSYDELVAELEALAAAHPSIARTETIGTSVRGRAIVGLRISDNVATNEMEPEARIIGAIHGNECMAYEVALGVARALVEGYGSDAVATGVVDAVETFIIPMTNPDGSAASTRGNADGVDLNRNFPFMWVAGESEGSPGSEPETEALRADGLLHPYVVGISYHTAADFVNLVWNYTPVAPRHEPELRALFEPYAVGTTYDVVLGWHWYSVYGEYTDHDYGTRGTLDTIVEIQNDYGTAGQLGIHVPRAVAMLALADDGLAGRVTDAATGAPLLASVWVAERRAPVFTEPGLGDFHEILVAGTYDVTVTAPRHRPAHVAGVVVPSSGHAWIDVALEPAGESFGFAVSSTILSQTIRDPGYPNESVPSDALGAPDGVPFWLEPYGEIVIDLGFEAPDAPGADLRIHAGPADGSDTAAVEGSAGRDGPWTWLGDVTGTGELDIGGSGLASLRYVHVSDSTGGRFGRAAAGYGIDAVEVAAPPAADADADAVDAADADIDADADAGLDADGDGSIDDGADGDAGPDAEVDGPVAADADAGGEESGESGVDVRPDGGVDGAEGGDEAGSGGGSGCGCAVSGGVPAGGPLPALAALAWTALGGAAWRRRRRGAR
ncbi:MAG: hypothetical protein HY907_00900 [Deltaproteobacteria bacterium]|nr:hypothetical protein [Deltaproteobacteria bacterium]